MRKFSFSTIFALGIIDTQLYTYTNTVYTIALGKLGSQLPIHLGFFLHSIFTHLSKLLIISMARGDISTACPTTDGHVLASPTLLKPAPSTPCAMASSDFSLVLVRSTSAPRLFCDATAAGLAHSNEVARLAEGRQKLKRSRTFCFVHNTL